MKSPDDILTQWASDEIQFDHPYERPTTNSSFKPASWMGIPDEVLGQKVFTRNEFAKLCAAINDNFKVLASRWRNRELAEAKIKQFFSPRNMVKFESFGEAMQYATVLTTDPEK